MGQITLGEFADKLNDIMPEIARGFLRQQANEMCKAKITVPQLLILNFLSKKKQVNMSDIADYLDASTAAATGIIARLVKVAYVKRVYSSDDRRIIKIELTSKGSEFVSKINNQKKQRIMDVFGKITDNQREEYLKILMRIHEIINEEKARQGTLG